MAGNIINNWAEFVSTSVSYFIIILLYAVIGADVIVLAKIFPETIITNNCRRDDLTYSEYIFPTDPKNLPYADSISCPKEKTQKTRTSLMTCESTDGKNTLGLSSNPGIIWNFLEKLGMNNFSWPYTNLYKKKDKEGKDEGNISYWVKYTIANIIYSGFTWNRLAFNRLTNVLDIMWEPLLLVFGPMFIIIIIFISNTAALIGSYWGAIRPIFNTGIGDLPDQDTAIAGTVIGLIIFIVLMVVQGVYPNIYTTWWGSLIFMIFMVIGLIFGGFLFVIPAINTFVVNLNTLLTLFYPLLAQNGQFILNVLFCNKEFITVLYTAVVCVIAYSFLNNTLAYTMWAVWFVMVAIKLLQKL